MIQILRNFENQVGRDADKIPAEILSSIKRFIIKTDTIDEADLITDLGFNEIASNVGYNFLISTDVGYEGFTNFPRPTYNLDGRYYFQSGIEAANIEQIFNEITFSAFE